MESLRRWRAQSCVMTGGYSIIKTTLMRCLKVTLLLRFYCVLKSLILILLLSVALLSNQRWSQRQGLHCLVPARQVRVGWRLLREVWLVLRGLQEQKQASLPQSFCSVLQTCHRRQWISQSERGNTESYSYKATLPILHRQTFPDIYSESMISKCSMLYCFANLYRLRTGGGRLLRPVLLATSSWLQVSLPETAVTMSNCK